MAWMQMQTTEATRAAARGDDIVGAWMGSRTVCRGAGQLHWLVDHFRIDEPRFIAILGRCAPCLLNSKTLLRV